MVAGGVPQPRGASEGCRDPATANDSLTGWWSGAASTGSVLPATPPAAGSSEKGDLNVLWRRSKLGLCMTRPQVGELAKFLGRMPEDRKLGKPIAEGNREGAMKRGEIKDVAERWMFPTEKSSEGFPAAAPSPASPRVGTLSQRERGF
jgi:hypothetical protein